MKIQEINSVSEYSTFILSVYKDDILFKDNKTSLIELICSPSSRFA